VNLSELRTEVFNRGFDYLNSTAGQARVDRWLNQAYLEICELHPWPFLEQSATGSPPLEISDLRQVLYVLDTTNKFQLRGVDVRDVVDADPTLATNGQPECYYLVGNSVSVWPVASVTLQVRYLRVPSELSQATDTPVLPQRWHDLIVDLAVMKAMKDSDNYEAASFLRSEVDRGVATMVQSLLTRRYDAPERIVLTEWKDY
jgi:hypothetical protein